MVYIPLDLLSRPTIHALVDDWQFPPIAYLVNNAALKTGGKPTYTTENIEKTFAACYVGHALLFFLLQCNPSGSLLTDDCRIILVGSGTHDPKEPLVPFGPAYVDAKSTAAAVGLDDDNIRYGTTKVAIALFSNCLARKAEAAGKGWTCLLYDPGFCPATGINRST